MRLTTCKQRRANGPAAENANELKKLNDQRFLPDAPTGKKSRRGRPLLNRGLLARHNNKTIAGMTILLYRLFSIILCKPKEARRLLKGEDWEVSCVEAKGFAKKVFTEQTGF